MFGCFGLAASVAVGFTEVGGGVAVRAASGSAPAAATSRAAARRRMDEACGLGGRAPPTHILPGPSCSRRAETDPGQRGRSPADLLAGEDRGGDGPAGRADGRCSSGTAPRTGRSRPSALAMPVVSHSDELLVAWLRPETPIMYWATAAIRRRCRSSAGSRVRCRPRRASHRVPERCTSCARASRSRCSCSGMRSAPSCTGTSTSSARRSALDPASTASIGTSTS